MEKIILIGFNEVPERERLTAALEKQGYVVPAQGFLESETSKSDILIAYVDSDFFDLARDFALNYFKSTPAIVMADQAASIMPAMRRFGAKDCILYKVPETSVGEYFERIAEQIRHSVSKINDDALVNEYPPLRYMRKFGIEIRGVIHVGAHKGQEIPYYEKLSGPVKYFEAVPRFVEETRGNIKTPNITVYEACCSDVEGEDVEFNIASHAGAASSMLEIPDEDWCAPAISYVDKFSTKTRRLESLLDEQGDGQACNLIAIDAQGADLKVIKGLGGYLKFIDGIYVEIADKPLYKGGATLRDIYSYLDHNGFFLTELVAENLDWGDAFFINRNRSITVQENVLTEKMLTCSKFADGHGVSCLIDGELDWQKPFFSTKGKNPWVKVEFEKATDISEILIFFRRYYQDTCFPIVVEGRREGSVFEIFDQEKQRRRPESTLLIQWRGAVDEIVIRPKHKNAGRIIMSQLIIR